MSEASGRPSDQRSPGSADVNFDEASAKQAPAGPKRKQSAPKGHSLLVLGCFGFLIFNVVVLVAVGGMTLLRASKGGVTVELARQSPDLATAAFGVVLNPNLELVEIDRFRNRLTMREKRTGHTESVTPEELRSRAGQGFGGGKPAGGSGARGGLFGLFRTGARLLGMGPRLPSWIPDYPGARAGGNMVNDAAGGIVGVARFTTRDPAQTVVRFYDRELRAAGLTVTVEQSGVLGEGSVTGQTADGSRAAVVRITKSGGKTAISLTYSERS